MFLLLAVENSISYLLGVAVAGASSFSLLVCKRTNSALYLYLFHYNSNYNSDNNGNNNSVREKNCLIKRIS